MTDCGGDCGDVSFFYRKGKTDAPKTPTTPTSPMSPSFSSAGGPLSPHLATGDSIRDKCIEMLTAALRTDSEAHVTPCYWEHTTQQLIWVTNSVVKLFNHLLLVRGLIYSFLYRWLQRIWHQLWKHGGRDWRSYPSLLSVICLIPFNIISIVKSALTVWSHISTRR